MSNNGFLNFGVIVLLTTVFVGGCSKPASQKMAEANGRETTGGPLNATGTPILKLHWVGKRKLSTDNNATTFMSLWRMAESEKLETQTLDKLASAPWRLLKTATPVSNAPVSFLRPLLDDLVQSESHLEVWGGNSQSAELALAVRLEAGRAAVWQTNLPVILKSIAPDFEVKPAANGGTEFVRPAAGISMHLDRAGDWTIMHLAVAQSKLKPQSSELLTALKARIQRDGGPVAARTTNYWLEVEADLVRVNRAFALNWPLPAETPSFNFVVRGDGTNVVTAGTLALSQPLASPLAAWQIPLNAVPKSLTSFTALRGLSSLVPRSSWFSDLQIGAFPDQLFIWSLPQFPMQTVLVLPLGQNDNRAALVQQRLLTAGNEWIATNSVGHWVEIEGGAGVQWEGAPFMTPFARPFSEPSGSFLGFGVLPTPLTNMVANSELAARLLARTNAVYYDWEFTGPRIESWFYMGQLARVMLGRGQLPPDALVTDWLKALQPRLSNSGTVITMVEPTKLSFERTSGLGLTAFELHLLADWLESPRFPLGLHTTEVPMKRKLSAMPPGSQSR